MNKEDYVGFYFPFYHLDISHLHDTQFYAHECWIILIESTIFSLLRFVFPVVFVRIFFSSALEENVMCSVHDSDIVEFCDKMKLPTVLCVFITDDGRRIQTTPTHYQHIRCVA